MIPEPQRTYLLELFAALGPAVDDFVVAGAQAMKFTVQKARGTKDVDFILNVLALRKEIIPLAKLLKDLGYTPVPESRNFQFVKPIPNSTETMRIEFMAPDEFRRRNDFRVDVQDGVHARACTGGSIALAESTPHTFSGKLPNGNPFTTKIRVSRPHALGSSFATPHRLACWCIPSTLPPTFPKAAKRLPLYAPKRKWRIASSLASCRPRSFMR